MASNGRTCEKCYHGNFPEKSQDLAQRVKAPETGECRIDSPKVFPIPGPKGELMFYAPFPSVKRECWCSKYTPEPAALN